MVASGLTRQASQRENSVVGLKHTIKRRLYERYFQWEVWAAPAQWPDLEPHFWPSAETCKPFTMTTTERLYALYKAVEHVISRGIAGDFVECGV